MAGVGPKRGAGVANYNPVDKAQNTTLESLPTAEEA